jgi:hypothetical protein
MNCLDFRRQCLIDPDYTFDEFLQHARICNNCEKFLYDIKSFNRHLHKAIKIDEPEKLQSNILLQQSFKQHGTKKPYAYFALAASLLIAIAITFFIDRNNSDSTLPDVVLAYVGEIGTINSSTPTVGISVINDVLQPLGMVLDKNFGMVQAVKPCVIRGQSAAHLVVNGETGSVNILYMPFENINRRIEIIQEAGQLILIPCPKGSLAIYGNTGEKLVSIEDRLRKASHWL